MVPVASAIEWPQEIQDSRGTVVVYEPQLESFEGDVLVARSAVAVTLKNQDQPVFGAVRYQCRVQTNREQGMAYFVNVDVTEVMFPNADRSQQRTLEELLEKNFEDAARWTSLDRLIAAVSALEEQQAAAKSLKSDPPRIIIASTPTVLVVLEGEPKLQRIEGSDLMRVINTPYRMVYDTLDRTYFLQGGAHWYSTQNVEGDWDLISDLPSSIQKLVEEDESSAPSNAGTSILDTPPDVIVSTEPAEILVTDGDPTYSPISGTGLLFVSNTDRDAFLHIDSQVYYILLSGRWYRNTPTEDGWENVASDALPEDFKRIPEASAKASVRTSVAGTVEAREAVANTYIPQTAAVKRGEAPLSVTYDGSPDFESIPNSQVSYALNTPYPVFQVGPRYYCCHEGVWYESGNSTGPWVVCTDVPAAIYSIPPSCPHYSVTYVRVYDTTPDVVYVGYTPGYFGSFLLGATVAYGTGYHYHSWHGHHYYPRPSTFGFAVRYNPITDNWGFAVGAKGPNGWIAGGKSSWTGNSWGGGVVRGGGGAWYGSGGWWGNGGYRDIDIDINNNIIGNNNRRNVYDRDVNRERNVASIDRSRLEERTLTGRETRESVSDRVSGRQQEPRGITERTPVRETLATPDQTARKNNVFADREGNVFRNSDTGWQQRDRSGWSSTPARRTESTHQFDRQQQSRDRGTFRTNQSRSFGQSRNSGYSRSGGGRSVSRSSGSRRR
jgi:hypothetical protein